MLGPQNDNYQYEITFKINNGEGMESTHTESASGNPALSIALCVEACRSSLPGCYVEMMADALRECLMDYEDSCPEVNSAWDRVSDAISEVENALDKDRKSRTEKRGVVTSGIPCPKESSQHPPPSE